MDNDSHKDTHLSVLVIAYLVVIAFGILIIVIAFPKISASVRESGMLELLQERIGSTKTIVQEERSTIVFPIISSEGISYQNITTKIIGNKPYHETIEQLLAGPNEEALALGCVSMIPEGTRLLGITVSQRIAFINLSREFLTTTVWGSQGSDIAKTQIKETLLSFPSIKDMVMLIEGSVY